VPLFINVLPFSFYYQNGSESVDVGAFPQESVLNFNFNNISFSYPL
jgi:hypothetical protein